MSITLFYLSFGRASLTDTHRFLSYQLSGSRISTPHPVAPQPLTEERVVRAAVIKDVMTGDEAAENRNYLQVTQPMEHGIVRN